MTGREPVRIEGRDPGALGRDPGHAPERVFPAGTYGVPCALVIGTRSEQTDRKTSLNDALRDFACTV